MTGKTHLIIGVVSGLALLDIRTAPASLLLAGIGSLLPDIDQPNSTISQKLKPIRWIYGLLFFWTSHRQFSHSIAVLIPLSALAYHTQNIYVIALTIGYISHIVADMLTVAGVPVFYPIIHRALHITPYPFRIKTGGILETIIGFLAIAAATILVSDMV